MPLQCYVYLLVNGWLRCHFVHNLNECFVFYGDQGRSSDRQLMVNVSISARDNCCIEVVLCCLATEGDGLGPQELNDGGVLATLLAVGFKGELVRFQDGVTMEISRLDAWYSSSDGSLKGPATYIVSGLCRRCCIPEVVLWCMQVSVSLMGSGHPPESHEDLIELVLCPGTGFLHLFGQKQMQEFLLFEREYSIHRLAYEEGIHLDWFG